MTVRAKPGAPLPYDMRVIKNDAGQMVQHAVVSCCDCPVNFAYPWVKQKNPTLICSVFERAGWVLYQNKARCPGCASARKKQQAHFAALNEAGGVSKPADIKETLNESLRSTTANVFEPTVDLGETLVEINHKEANMQTLRAPQLNNPPRVVGQHIPPQQPAHQQPIDVPPVIRTVYVLVIGSDGSANVMPAGDVREMLLGDETFLVVPYEK